MGENKLTEHRLRTGGIRGFCAYLLITARLVLCGEGCLTATLLGSAIWTKWVWVIGPVLIRKYLHNPESCLERMDTLCNFLNAVMPSANIHYYVLLTCFKVYIFLIKISPTVLWVDYPILGHHGCEGGSYGRVATCWHLKPLRYISCIYAMIYMY